jgi:hypothetical protein
MSEKFIASLLAGFLVAGCASPTVVQSVKPGDAGLNCAQLQNEFADADNFKKEADGVKGVTGGNVARLLFWPSIVGTYMNANEAIAAADNRKVNLSNLMSQKGCAVPGAMQNNENNSTNQQVSQAQTTEMKLVDLKKLFDNNLISREAYEQRQKAILEGR